MMLVMGTGGSSHLWRSMGHGQDVAVPSGSITRPCELGLGQLQCNTLAHRHATTLFSATIASDLWHCGDCWCVLRTNAQLMHKFVLVQDGVVQGQVKMRPHFVMAFCAHDAQSSEHSALHCVLIDAHRVHA